VARTDLTALPDLYDLARGNDAARPYWNPERETMPAERLAALQLEKLRVQLRYLRDNSALYQAKFRESGVAPEDVRSLADLALVPFTTKHELRASQDAAPPFGLHQAAPMDRIVRTTATSGTSGKPVYQGYSRNDVLRRSESVCRGFWGYGIRPGDRVVNGFALSMFSAGVPFNVGLEQLGAVSIPAGAERKAEGVLKIIRDLRATALVSTPSFAAYLAEKSPEVLGVPARELGVRVICGGGESGFEQPAFQQLMEQQWGTPFVYDWASSSDAHPNIFAHCAEREGKHHLTGDMVLTQLIDPATGAMREIADGAEGEYIITHLDREACPLLRYRTGDILRVRTKPCACGRTGFRMDIIGRSDDMLIVRGINVFPIALVNIVGEFVPQATGKAQVVLQAAGTKVEPPVRLRVECGDGIDPGSAQALEMKAGIEKKIRADLSVTTNIELVAFGRFERTAAKTRLVVIEPA